MITNAEARDTYKNAYEKAKELYSDICNQSSEFQETISKNRSISQEAEEELGRIQSSLDAYSKFKDTCITLKDEDVRNQNSMIKEYAEKFGTNIVHSEITVNIEECYSENLTKIINSIDNMLESLKRIIELLNTQKDEAYNRKITADEAVNTASSQLNNMESTSSVASQIEENFYQYKYYCNKCEEDGEDADSGLH